MDSIFRYLVTLLDQSRTRMVRVALQVDLRNREVPDGFCRTPCAEDCEHSKFVQSCLPEKWRDTGPILQIEQIDDVCDVTE